jgi:murein DD-endopeptidase MepM/ murein hydrolase activator NlpD
MIPTLLAGSLVVVAATAGMGDGPADTAADPAPDPHSGPTRFELASASRAADHGAAQREMLAGTTTTTAPKTPPTTAPPPPPPTTAPPTTEAPEPEPEPEPAPAPRAGADIVCPVDGAVSFTDSFGAARSGHSHQGVDMMAARGVPTVAPVSGVVEHNESSSGGLAWYVHGDDGNTYFGAHLSGYENGTGWVEAGTVIGYVGSTGNASGGAPHLHFEFHPGGGSAVDPYDLVSAAC